MGQKRKPNGRLTSWLRSTISIGYSLKYTISHSIGDASLGRPSLTVRKTEYPREGVPSPRASPGQPSLCTISSGHQSSPIQTRKPRSITNWLLLMGDQLPWPSIELMSSAALKHRRRQGFRLKPCECLVRRFPGMAAIHVKPTDNLAHASIQSETDSNSGTNCLILQASD